MSDELPTVWPLEPHTEAKHAILKSYLQAWAPILARRAKKLGLENKPLRFIDGFAGPGIYEKGEPGSPVLAVNAIFESRRPELSEPVSGDDGSSFVGRWSAVLCPKFRGSTRLLLQGCNLS